MQRSDDDGLTWRRFAGPVVGGGSTTATATFDNDIGPIVADPRTHDVFESYAAAASPAHKDTNLILNVIYVARSTNRGSSWTSVKVFQGAPDQSFGNPFPQGLALDPVTGGLSAAWSDGQSVFFSRSTDHGSTWSSTNIVNTAPAVTALFPALAAYGGVVDLAYYGTSAASKDDPSAVWNVYMAKSTDGGVTFAQSAVTSTPNHVGVICTEGSACFSGDRTLADLFEIAIDHRSLLAAIAYAGDTFGAPFRITSGPNEGEYPSAECLFTRSLLMLPGAEMKGATRYVGLACSGDPVPPAVEDGEIAAAMRGNCLFSDKAQAAIDAGYDGFVAFNFSSIDLFGGDRVFPIGAPSFSFRDIPCEFVGHSTGLAIFNAASDSDLVVGEPGATISVGRLRVQAALAYETP